MLAISYKNAIKVWNILEKKLLWENNEPHIFTDYKGKKRLDKINEISFSNEDTYIFTSSDNSDKQWKIKECDVCVEFHELKEFTSKNNLNCFDFSPDNKYLTIGTDDGGLFVYDLTLMQNVLYNDTDDSAPLQQVKFNTDGTYLATIDFNKTAKLHKLEFMTEEMLSNQKHSAINKDEEFQIKPRKIKDQWDETEQPEEEETMDDFLNLEIPDAHKIEDQSLLKISYKTKAISNRANTNVRTLSFRADGQYLLINCKRLLDR